MSSSILITYVKRGPPRATYHDVPCRNLRNLRRKVRRIMREPDVARIILRRDAGSQLSDAMIICRDGNWVWSVWAWPGVRRLMGKGWKP